MLLTVLIFMPLAGALPLLLVRDQNAREIKIWALLVSLFTFAASLALWQFDATPGRFDEMHRWIEIKGLTINYSLGVDGISMLLILLTTLITPVALLGAFNYIKVRQKEFYLALLVLETAMIGVFAATDLFLFYVFFEASLIPMYFIIGIWGGEQRIYATTKFIVFTAFGSLLMFIAILYVYFKTGASDFGIAHLTAKLAEARASGALTKAQEIWCFWAFALAFGIKVPLFPLHTWLPDAHTEAPTPGSVILASILLKMGGYGFLRLGLPFFPRAAELYMPLFMTLCVIGIIYGALMAFAQTDIKRLIAYSSVAHMGVCMLGIFSLKLDGVQGGVYQMLNHGVSTGALFLLVGMLYERTHSRAIDQHSGLAKAMPVYATFFVLITLSSIGLPLTNGFVGEFFCLYGAFMRNPWFGFLGATGMIFGAVYMLNLVKRVFFGKLRVPRAALLLAARAADTPPPNPLPQGEGGPSLPDLTGREWAVLLPVAVLVVVMGVAPSPFFKKMEPAAKQFLQYTESGKAK